MRTSSPTESVGEVIVACPDNPDEDDKHNDRDTHLSVHSMSPANRMIEMMQNALKPITCLPRQGEPQLTEHP